MKSFSFLIAVIFVGITFTSCNQQVKEDRLKRIDSLGVHLNYIAETLEEMDSIMLVNRINDIRVSSGWIIDNITDTLDQRPGLIFGDFVRSKKYLEQAVTRYDEVRKELNYSRRQLETLRTDVKENFFSEEEFKGYFNTESASIERLIHATDELKSKYETSNERYTSLKPKMNHILDSIKAVIYAPTKGNR
jgi:uncharacterized coiled-coil DUF342 family protein